MSEETPGEQNKGQLLPVGSVAFMRPVYHALSAWTEHVPFAFWLIEAVRPKIFVELGTHLGMSYFAFCQAIEKLNLDTKSFAVDLWTGDEHSGSYGPEVYNSVRGHNEALYSRFSSLEKNTFDDACTYFVDGTVDLLHIDGLHTYEAVKHDFETWLPKLSQTAIVLFHDTNVRERDFGVFRFFQELRSRYSAFEFSHGHGLGVICVGECQIDQLKSLFDTNEASLTNRAFLNAFSTLGRGCLTEYKSRNLQKELADTKRMYNEQKGKMQADSKFAGEKIDKIISAVEYLSKSMITKHFGTPQKIPLDAEGSGGASMLHDTAIGTRSQSEPRRAEIDLEEAQTEDGALGGRKLLKLQKELLDQSRRHSQELLSLSQENETHARQRFEELKILSKLLLEQEERVRQLVVERLEQTQNAEKVKADFDAKDQALTVVLGERDLLRNENRQLWERFERFAEEKALSDRHMLQHLVESDVARCAEIGKLMRKILDLPFPWRLLPSNVRLARQMALLRKTGLFDPDWYASAHKDVSASRMDPAKHYIYYGSKEGRAPNAGPLTHNSPEDEV